MSEVQAFLRKRFGSTALLKVCFVKRDCETVPVLLPGKFQTDDSMEFSGGEHGLPAVSCAPESPPMFDQCSTMGTK